MCLGKMGLQLDSYIELVNYTYGPAKVNARSVKFEIFAVYTNTFFYVV